MDVLIIEPDYHLAASYKLAMEAEGLMTRVVHSGQDAIAVLDDCRVRLICLELHLPGNNGVEFLHELRSYPEWEDIPVVLLTYVPEPDLKFAQAARKQLGINYYFYKPHTQLAKLIGCIKQALA